MTGGVTRPSQRKPVFVVLAEGRFGLEGSKTAASAIRYLPDRVTAILDSEHAGQQASDVLGIGEGIPVVGTLEEALDRSPAPEALLIGVATQGGVLPDAWRPLLQRAVAAGLDVWSGLHGFLADDPELREAAREHGVGLVDLRRAPRGLPVATGKAAGTDALRVLTVGTDCNVGKMTTTLEVQRELRRRGRRPAFGATGQTGILIAGRGIAVDAVVADFVAGAAERLTLEAAGEIPPLRGGEGAAAGNGAAGDGSTADDRADGGSADGGSADDGPAAGERPEVVLVEGQGSLMHPGYSGVTLGLLHGTMPQAMILCWMPSRDTIYSGDYDWVTLPPLEDVVRLYEDAASWVRPPESSRVVAISACTYDLDEAEARRHVEEAQERTGLPVTDPVRFGPGPLADAVERAMDGRG